jgi:hypothetical protein
MFKVKNISFNIDFSKDVDIELDNGETYLVQLHNGKFETSEHCKIFGYDRYNSCCEHDGELLYCNHEELRDLLVIEAEQFANSQNNS